MYGSHDLKGSRRVQVYDIRRLELPGMAMTGKTMVAVPAVTPQALPNTDPVTGPSATFEANLVEPGRTTQAGKGSCIIDARSPKKRRKKRLSSTAGLRGEESPTKVMKSGIGGPTDSHTLSNWRRPSNAPATSIKGPIEASWLTAGVVAGAKVGVGGGVEIGSGLVEDLSAIGDSPDRLEGSLPHTNPLHTNLQFAAVMPHTSTDLGLFPASLGQPAFFGNIGDGRYDGTNLGQQLTPLRSPSLSAGLPVFVQPICVKTADEDIGHLRAGGALDLPPLRIQNALLQVYIECVHPHMPMLDLHNFLAIINARTGQNGQISLLLYQAVMFAATAVADADVLMQAGDSTGIQAMRNAFFRKAKSFLWQLLLHLDCRPDRLVRIQALLLMTYGHEAPNDEASWDLMDDALKLAHEVDLHRKSTTVSMSPREKQLWKRVWWSCFMRDHLLALSMRRPPRIKNEHFDIAMLEETDFELLVLPEDKTIIPVDCALLRDVAMQQDLTALCISRAQLCIGIGRVLEAQYSVLVNDETRPEPSEKLDSIESANSIYTELSTWAKTLPPACQYRPLHPSEVDHGRSIIAVQRTILHMIYFTTISALFCPQFPFPSPFDASSATSRRAHQISRWYACNAATRVTSMASEIKQMCLERHLTTLCVTVLLPAAMTHFLDLSSPEMSDRKLAASGFRQCVDIMKKLRKNDALSNRAMDFFLDVIGQLVVKCNPQQAYGSMEQIPMSTGATCGAQAPRFDDFTYINPANTKDGVVHLSQRGGGDLRQTGVMNIPMDNCDCLMVDRAFGANDAHGQHYKVEERLSRNTDLAPNHIQWWTI
ncbi:hypothetical protein CcaCcLH18_12843 [Colletotrichum camelliae]|nr:hypothetical protein CcaCcLH18_12843 [Colletotrichum camelliae]